MSETALWVIVAWLLGALLLLLLVAPTAIFLKVNWTRRCQEILSGVTSKKDIALKDYFNWFHQSFEPGKPPAERFALYYDSLYGRKHFLIPFAMFIVISAVLIFVCDSWFIQAIKYKMNISERPEAVAVFAILGAFLWISVDHINKWWHSELSHRDLFLASLRMIMAVPIAFSLTRILGEGADAALPTAFILGAFPLGALLSMFRKIGRQKLNVADAEERGGSELIKLQGIDAAMAERFAAENLTTICQLAYSDPIRMTIRTNLGFSYIVDLIAQALLMIYSGESYKKWLQLGLRGGFEVTNILDGLENGDPQEVTDSEQIIKELAGSLGISPSAVRNIMWEVANDPYMEFIYASWTSAS